MIQSKLQRLLVLHKEYKASNEESIRKEGTTRTISHGELLQSTDTPDLSVW